MTDDGLALISCPRHLPAERLTDNHASLFLPCGRYFDMLSIFVFWAGVPPRITDMDYQRLGFYLVLSATRVDLTSVHRTLSGGVGMHARIPHFGCIGKDASGSPILLFLKKYFYSCLQPQISMSSSRIILLFSPRPCCRHCYRLPLLYEGALLVAL